MKWLLSPGLYLFRIPNSDHSIRISASSSFIYHQTHSWVLLERSFLVRHQVTEVALPWPSSSTLQLSRDSLAMTDLTHLLWVHLNAANKEAGWVGTRGCISTGGAWSALLFLLQPSEALPFAPCSVCHLHWHFLSFHGTESENRLDSTVTAMDLQTLTYFTSDHIPSARASYLKWLPPKWVEMPMSYKPQRRKELEYSQTTTRILDYKNKTKQ